MADEKTMNLAKQIYATLCETLEDRNWKFGKSEEELIVHFGVSGEDIIMPFVFLVDADRQLVRLVSMLPFNMSESKRLEGAIATCAASYELAHGNFDYDISSGQIVFRIINSFRDSVLGKECFDYMITAACAIIDRFNDQFLALDKGEISIAEFISKV